MDFTDYSGLAAIVLAILAIYKAWRQTPHEVVSTDADAVAKFEEAATKAVDRALKLEARLQEIESKLDTADKKIKVQTHEIYLLNCEIEDLKDWAERLVFQVQSLGQSPVKVRERPSKPREEG